ncbi:MAG: isoprenylcysteine carboxylmethyltransferase family protein [Candidatus Aminicenantes bacterium]|jgi:protein-S-isoprenylcysteine O-methyltransferase Ste14
MTSKIKNIVRGIVLLGTLMALFFGSAGTFNWIEAWLFLLFYAVVVTVMVAWLKKNDPELLKERMTRKKDAKTWDKIILTTYSVLVMIMLVLAGFDAIRYQWTYVPLGIKVLGFLGFIPAFLLVFWTMTQNRYLSEVVRIQEERGHKVCTTGPYRYIRHPMYMGVIIFVLCFPLALGSLMALILSVLIIVVFLIRTSLEDKTLHKELEGYKEYAEKVRYKLIPGVW